jgi:hypothetical protein
MLLRQYQFPDTFEENEKHITADHDRCISWDSKHAMGCFKRHTGVGELGFESWLPRVDDVAIMAFLKDILKADPQVSWTGYRVMGTVNRGNGYPVWTLELFAKNPKSNTQVYTGPRAPNVRNRATALV